MVLFFLIACGEPAPAQPPGTDGSYDISLDEWDGGDCQFEAIHFHAVDTTALLAFEDATHFSIDYVEAERDPLACTATGADFDCEQREELTSDYGDASVTSWFTQNGSWTSTATLDGRFIYTFTCDGDDCGDLTGTPYGPDASFPCTLSGPWTGELAP